MRALRTALLTGAALLAASSAGADTLYTGADEHHAASVAIVLTRTDLSPWPARSDEVQAYCFFHAANVAHVDGRWYAINGISLSGLDRHWIEADGRRERLEDEHRTPTTLRNFLYAINDKLNEACP